MNTHAKIVVLISADIEWRAVRRLFPKPETQTSPYGEWFSLDVDTGEQSEPVIIFHSGWGKISAAGSTQYCIDRWSPSLLINLGTCGGIEGKIERGVIVLVDKTIVYDIIEQMGDPDEHIAHYSTQIDLHWLDQALTRRSYPQVVQRNLLASGDRDLVIEEIPHLKEKYGAAAGDWESGAIAWVAAHNDTRLLILRGVTDLVGSSGGEAYGNIELFETATQKIMQRLFDALPGWIGLYNLSIKKEPAI